MLKRNIYMFLRPHEDAALLTVKGRLHLAITHNAHDLNSNSDALQEMMVDVMKHPEAKKKDWIWKISDHWSSLSGTEL